MQELGLNKIHRTGNPQVDALAVEVERAQIAASNAASKADRANTGVERLDSVRLKNHGLLQPVTVYGTQDKQAQEIVLTRVTKNEAVGYVLVPKTKAAAIGN